MTEKTLNEAIHEKLNLITPTLKAIQGGGEQAYLGDLRTLLRKNLASLLALLNAIRVWMPQQPIFTLPRLPSCRTRR
jgi:hypothetical protein